jgi:UDP-N-acetyl-D-glucosamine dehydrogenase
MKSKKLTARMLKSYDVVLISTNHSSYDYEWIAQNTKLLVDTRNATSDIKKGRKKIVKA